MVYKYDGSGERVMKVTAGETIYYIPGGEASSLYGLRKMYVTLGGKKIVGYSNSTTYFFHHDHTGTPRAQTNIAGNVVETWEYYPYGEQWIHQGGVGNKHRYTGHLRDAESENDYAGARYYTNRWGRWLSVDPELGDIYNPQRLNRYSYVMNDPVNLVDPDGRNPQNPCDLDPNCITVVEDYLGIDDWWLEPSSLPPGLPPPLVAGGLDPVWPHVMPLGWLSLPGTQPSPPKFPANIEFGRGLDNPNY